MKPSAAPYRRRLSAAGLILLLTACAQPEPATDASPAAWSTCTNPATGYTISYPAGWRANASGVMAACTLFDPGNVAVGAGTEIPYDIAVAIVVEDAPLVEAIAGYRAVQVLQEEATEVGGRSAFRLEVIDPEPITGDRPLRSSHYLIDLGAETLVASSYADGDLAYSAKRQVLDRMVHTLSFIKSASP